MGLRTNGNTSAFTCLMSAVARRSNIKGAESIINKAIDVVSNYAHYAQLANIDEHWTNKILDEIKYRIEQVNS